MRVISGLAKGRKLRKVPGDTTRPITDRAKESLFNIMANRTAGGRWLDLFAGTGQVGIEALSRGASEAVFVDIALEAVRTTRRNLELTGLTARAKVIRRDAFNYLVQRAGRPFDVIYVAPPQYKKMWAKALLLVDQEPSRVLAPKGIVIVQIDPREYEECELANLRLTDQRRYGTTMFCFYEL